MYSLFSTNFTLHHKHTLNHILKVQASWSYSPVSACWLSLLPSAPTLSSSFPRLDGNTQLTSHAVMRTHTSGHHHILCGACCQWSVPTPYCWKPSTIHPVKKAFTTSRISSGGLLHFDLNHFKLCNGIESLKKGRKGGRKESKEGRKEGREGGGRKERKKRKREERKRKKERR